MPATVISDWPTPTVSTSTTSKPLASRTVIDCMVARATPPSVPAVGDGRMYASGLVESLAMRVLSPSTDPPVRMLDGSTASTPTLWPSETSHDPSASMKVDLPTPGTPEMPTRTAPPAPILCAAVKASSSSRASAR